MKPLYDWEWSVEKKIETIAKELYGAAAIDYTTEAKSDLKKVMDLGLDKLPVCIAKTQKSVVGQPEITWPSERFRGNGTSDRDCIWSWIYHPDHG